jgi:hypothetical protein
MSLAGLESFIISIQKNPKFKEVTKMNLVTDNGPHFNGNIFIVNCSLITFKYGLQLVLVKFEAGK